MGSLSRVTSKGRSAPIIFCSKAYKTSKSAKVAFLTENCSMIHYIWRPNIQSKIMHFLSAILEKYIADHSQPEPEILKKLTRETHLKVIRPRMITGHFQGRVLSLLSKIIGPRNILEIGTYT